MKKIGSSAFSMLILGILVFSMLTTRGIAPNKQVREDQTQLDTSGLVKIISYNTIEGGRNPEWKNIIRDENPDIFFQIEAGFQENLEPWKNELNSYFPNEDPYSVVGFDASSGTDGQAIYSRFPIVSSKVISTVLLDDGTNYTLNHPFMQAILNIHGMDVMTLANHLSCCDNLPMRMKEQEGLMNYFDTLDPHIPIIYGGDFNSNSPQDVDGVEPIQSDLGVAPIDMMINSSNPLAPKDHIFYDTYRILNPDRKGHTYELQAHFRGRIDYIFVNQELTNYLVNSSVINYHPDVDVASDHRPIYTWFNFKPEVDLRPPIDPQHVKLDQVTSSSTTISWDANPESDIFKYSVYRNGSLLSDIQGNQTSFVDDYEYNPSAVYLYEVSATDTSGNEGRVSLPVWANTGAERELFAPYNIKVQAYKSGSTIGLNWTGNSGGLDSTYVTVFKEIDPTSHSFITHDTYYNQNSTVTSFPTSFKIYFKIIMGNAIGVSDLTNYTYYGDTSITVNDPTYDRTNIWEYGDVIWNATADFSMPEKVIPLPGSATTTTSASISSSSSVSSTSPTTGMTSSTEKTSTAASPLPAIVIFLTLTLIPMARKVKFWKLV